MESLGGNEGWWVLGLPRGACVHGGPKHTPLGLSISPRTLRRRLTRQSQLWEVVQPQPVTGSRARGRPEGRRPLSCTCHSLEPTAAALLLLVCHVGDRGRQVWQPDPGLGSGAV